MSKLEQDYTIKESLGSGSYAEVFRCSHKSGGDYALKVINKSKAGTSGLQSVKNEVVILQSLKHPNIIFVRDFIETNHSVYIVLELVLGGELFDKIVELKHYSEVLAAKLIRNICDTLQYMHAKGVCHRDLKPENLLLKEKLAKAPTQALGADATNAELAKFESILTNIKLVDFGFAINFEPGTSKMTECCGTPNFIAPEILDYGYFKSRKEGYNEKCDIWSTGVLTYILLCGYPPFHATSRAQMFRRISQGEFVFHTNTVWDQISPEAKDFVKKLMNKNPKDRYSAEQALQHPWMKQAAVNLYEKSNSNVHLEETMQNFKTFNARRKIRAAIFGMEAAHRMMYVTKCKELNVKPNTALTQQLAKEEEGGEDITTLDLTNNYLGVKGLRAALEAIGPTSTIDTLKLNNNQIDNTGVTVICEALKTRPNVTSIDLSDNPITQLAGRQLLNFIQENRNVVQLGLERTMLKETMLAKIEAQIQRNQAAAKNNPNCSVM